MITKASSCCFSELPDFTISKNIGETTIMRYVKCMGAIHQTLLGSGQAPVTPVHRQITHNVYAVVISQDFKLLHGFWYSAIRITKGLKPTSYTARENCILLQCFEARFVNQMLFSVLLKKKCVQKKQLFYSKRMHSLSISNKLSILNSEKSNL